ncbi:ABC transporter permease, partial [Yersinia enterocolitica]|nr:ABC transporter permease [Yersinia enterocolitica]
SMAVGEGARQEILNEISQLGTSNLDIRPGLGWDKPRPDFERALSQADIELLSQQPYVDSLSPVVSKMVAAVRGDKQVMVSLSGVSNGFFQVKGLNFSVGDSFTHSHVNAREPVVILQPELSDTLFAAGQNPLGEIVQLDGIPLRVIGVAKRGGSSFGGLLAAWMPYTSLTERISGDIPLESI